MPSNDEIPIRDQMSLAEYHRQVRQVLITIQHCSTEHADSLMKEYESSMQEFYEEDYPQKLTAYGMVMHYL